MFGGEIGASPWCEDERRFAYDINMLVTGGRGHIEEWISHKFGKPVGKDNTREEQQTAKTGIEKEYRNDSVVVERFLFTDFVTA